MSAPGALVVAATPLGNPGDASARFVQALADARVIAAEDTRRLYRLARELGVALTADVISLHDAVEAGRTRRIVDRLHRGESVLLVSDAGMPLISDPGYRLVRACVEEGVPITVLPGPSAVLAALAVSGLPVDRFCFEGFLPRRAGERRRRIEDLADERRTMVFFEAPHRLADTLAAMAAGFGADRAAAICRELTKTYEEVRRGTLGELHEALGEPRGEITLVVAGATSDKPRGEPSEWAADVMSLEATGLSRRDAISSVAQQRGIPRRDVYDCMIRAKAGSEPIDK